jgi:hypothetical protein
MSSLHWGHTWGSVPRWGSEARGDFAGLCRSRSNSMSDLVEEEIANFKARRFHFRALPFLKLSDFRFCIFPLSKVGPQHRGCGWGYARRCCIPMSSSDQPLRADLLCRSSISIDVTGIPFSTNFRSTNAASVKSPCS